MTLQLIEMGLPLVLNLNMMDEAKERGIEIKEKKLEEILQIGVVSTIATEGLGIDKLFKSLQKKTFSSYRVSYDENVDEALEKMERLRQPFPIGDKIQILEFSVTEIPC